MPSAALLSLGLCISILAATFCRKVLPFGRVNLVEHGSKDLDPSKGPATLDSNKSRSQPVEDAASLDVRSSPLGFFDNLRARALEAL